MKNMTTIIQYLYVTSCTASLVRLRPIEYKAIVGYVKTTRTRSQFTGYLNKNMTGYVKQDVQDH